MNLFYFMKQCPAYLLTTFLVLLSSLDLVNIAEARTLHSSMYFVGKYKNGNVYGVLNEWDGRACTLINNKITVGLVSKNNKILFPPNREVKIIDTLLLNPASAGQIPRNWINNPRFLECSNKMIYAECFIRAGVRYYKTDNEIFRDVTKTRMPILSIGTMTNSYTRDEETDSLEWASFSFKNSNNNTDNNFIVNYKSLDCKNKL
jgi:hypothetical protein